MKRNDILKTIWLLLFFSVVIFFLVLLFLNTIESQILSFIKVYGYIALFIFAILIDILVQPIGPEAGLITANILGLNNWAIIIISIAGTSIASLISYRIGKLFYLRLCKDNRCSKYLTFYEKYGKFGLLVSAMTPIPYVPFCWFSGAFGLPIKEFIYFGILPRILRIIIVSSAIGLFL
ncbi:MAG: VTT domain-containing protein [Nanoarchaeota archaeon]|nr:VTT domain-containing protein [Nanoarchaeota archaeon]MBU1004805.1 VTT domain-containing protein [Nanoarchaeota archaeon]MBU1946997.1 VTT domain-containing protein [Nanoarchaeota archaeon]